MFVVLSLALACFALLAFLRFYTALVFAAVCACLFIKYRSVRLFLLLGWAALLNRDTTPHLTQLAQHMWSKMSARVLLDAQPNGPLLAQMLMQNMKVVEESEESEARPVMRRPRKYKGNT